MTAFHWEKAAMEIVSWVKEKCIVHLRHSGPCAEDPSTKEVAVYKKKRNCKLQLQFSVIWTVIKGVQGSVNTENKIMNSEDIERESSTGMLSEGRWSRKVNTRNGLWGDLCQMGERRDAGLIRLVISLETTWKINCKNMYLLQPLDFPAGLVFYNSYSSEKNGHPSGSTGLHPSRSIKLWLLAGCPGERNLFIGGCLENMAIIKIKHKNLLCKLLKVQTNKEKNKLLPSLPRQMKQK